MTIDGLHKRFINYFWCVLKAYTDGLEQDCSNTIANALELLQSSVKPSI